MKAASSDSVATRSRKLCLTNTAVKSASPGETLWDTEVTGLHLRVKPAGAAYFLYYRTKSGRERRPKLGDASIIALVQAREDARALLAQVAAGKDPALERELVRESPTVEKLMDRVYKDHWSRKKTAREIRRRFESYVQGTTLAKLRVREAEFDDIARLHASMADTPYQANRVLADLSKAFNFAERPLKWRDKGTNPCHGVVHFPELKRKKFFKREHLQRLLPVLAAYAATPGDDQAAVARRRAAAFLTFQLYTGTRPEEPEAITPEMVDGTVVRLDDAKTGQRDIYCPPQAMAALRLLPWVKGRPILGRFPKKLWQRIRKDAGCEDLWARDTRRTFGTSVLSTAHGAQAGNLLGQKSAQTTKIYALLLEDSAMEAAAAGADRIDQLGKVSP